MEYRAFNKVCTKPKRGYEITTPIEKHPSGVPIPHDWYIVARSGHVLACGKRPFAPPTPTLYRGVLDTIFP